MLQALHCKLYCWTLLESQEHFDQISCCVLCFVTINAFFFSGTFHSEIPSPRNWSYLRNWSYPFFRKNSSEPFPIRKTVPQKIFQLIFLRNCSRNCSRNGSRNFFSENVFEETIQELFLQCCCSGTVPKEIFFGNSSRSCSSGK